MFIVWPWLFNILPTKNYKALAFWPVIFLKSDELKSDQVLINHEKIHLRQQVECLVLPFYLIYFSDYLRLRFKGLNHDAAYRGIIFEREAYTHDGHPDFLKTRRPWATFRKN